MVPPGHRPLLLFPRKADQESRPAGRGPGPAVVGDTRRSAVALLRRGQPVEAVAEGGRQVETFGGEILFQMVDPRGARDRQDDR